MRSFALAFVALSIWFPTAALAVPLQINHEGLLLDTDGLPLQGQVVLRFSLYGQEAGGNALWFEEYQLGLVDGYYNLLLGSQTPLGGIFDGNPRWLAISINGGLELTPRRAVASVPYALVALSAQSAATAQSAASAQTAQNVVGDITPHTITVNGKLVVDAQGIVTGQPPGGQGYNTAPQVLAALITVDGSGSGLDADTLDSHDSADFLLVTLLQAKIQAVDGTGSGIDADKLDGLDGTAYATQADLALGLAAVNADKLDGHDSTDFLLAGAQCTDSDKLDGKHASAFLSYEAGKSDPAQQIVDWLAAKYDLQPAPLNAHKLDGLDSADFLRAGAKAVDADKLDVLDSTAFLTSAGKAADADRLDGLDSAQFLLAGGKAADSDLLDGQHATAFLAASAKALDADRLDNLDSSDFLRANGKAVDADRLDGLDSAQLLNLGDLRAPAQVLGLLAGGDGAGSGLDADLLDGVESARFMRSDQDTATSGSLQVGGNASVAGNLSSTGTLSTREVRVAAGARVGVGVANPQVEVQVEGTVMASAFVAAQRVAAPANPLPGTIYFDTARQQFYGFDGASWMQLGGKQLGSSAALAGLTCKAIKDTVGGSLANGLYWIDPNGGNTSDAFQAYCDMTNNGGGWTLAVIIDGATQNHSNVAQVGALPITPSDNGTKKMSDTVIQSLITEPTKAQILFTCDGTNHFFRDCSWRATKGLASNADRCVWSYTDESLQTLQNNVACNAGSQAVGSHCSSASPAAHTYCSHCVGGDYEYALGRMGCGHDATGYSKVGKVWVR